MRTNIDETGWVSINPMRESNSTRQPGGNLGKDRSVHGVAMAFRWRVAKGVFDSGEVEGREGKR